MFLRFNTGISTNNVNDIEQMQTRKSSFKSNCKVLIKIHFYGRLFYKLTTEDAS